MLLMGDEVRRTQLGNNNMYCHDDETSWFDWTMLGQHGEVRRFVERLIAHRLNLVAQRRWHDEQTLADFLREARIQIHGVKLHQPDWGDESHSLAFTALGPAGGMFHLMINAFWKPLEFEISTEQRGRWRRWIDTSLSSPDDICEIDEAPLIAGPTYFLQPRSIACLFTQAGPSTP